VRDGAYARVPCWFSAARWLRHASLLAVRWHAQICEALGIRLALTTLVRYLMFAAASADHSTGRGMRVSNATFAARLGCTDRTVRNCSRVTRVLGLETVVFAGRRLTPAERRRALRARAEVRGWANECALHESRLRPGRVSADDERAVDRLLVQAIETVRRPVDEPPPPALSPACFHPPTPSGVVFSVSRSRRVGPGAHADIAPAAESQAFRDTSPATISPTPRLPEEAESPRWW